MQKRNGTYEYLSGWQPNAILGINFVFFKVYLKKSWAKSGIFALFGTYLISYQIMQKMKKPDYSEYYTQEEFDALVESGVKSNPNQSLKVIKNDKIELISLN